MKTNYFTAVTNDEETNGNSLLICKGDLPELYAIADGSELMVASSGESVKVKYVNGNRIIIDKPVFSMNVKVLKRGELLILKDTIKQFDNDTTK